MPVLALVQENMRRFREIQQEVSETRDAALKSPPSDLKALLAYHARLSTLYETADVNGEILINLMKNHGVAYDSKQYKEAILHLKSHRKEKAKKLLCAYPPLLALTIYFEHYPKAANNYHVQANFDYFFPMEAGHE